MLRQQAHVLVAQNDATMERLACILARCCQCMAAERVINDNERLTLAMPLQPLRNLVQPGPFDDFRYQDYPAIKLARLSVDASLQGKGIGSQLVDFVIGLVVVAKPTSVSFYERVFPL